MPSPTIEAAAAESELIRHALEMAERAIDGLVDSGIRAVFAHGTAKPLNQNDDIPFTHVPHPRDRVEALRKGRLASDDSRVTLAMAILGPAWCTWEVLEHDIRPSQVSGGIDNVRLTALFGDWCPPSSRRQVPNAGTTAASPGYRVALS